MPLGIPLELLAVLLGGLITLAGTAVFNWNNRRRARIRLSRALANEVKIMGSSLEKLTVSTHAKLFPETELNVDDFEYIDEDFSQQLGHPDYHPLAVLAANRVAVFPTDVFESNANQIGMINSLAAGSLIIFYSRIRQIRNTLAELEAELDSDESTTANPVTLRKLNSLGKNAIKFRKAVLESLNVDQSLFLGNELSWTPYERFRWPRGEKYSYCERCGSQFDVANGYATIEMGVFPPSDIPDATGGLLNFGLCETCRMRFDDWLDRGAVERQPRQE